MKSARSTAAAETVPVSPSRLGWWLATNLVAIAAGVVGIVGGLVAAGMLVDESDGWSAFGLAILWGLAVGAVAYLVALAVAVQRWLPPSNGVFVAVATVVSSLIAGVIAATVVGLLDDGRGDEDVVIGWLAVLLSALGQLHATELVRRRTAGIAASGVVVAMVVAGVAL